MVSTPPPGDDVGEVRAAEIVAAMSLATDLGMGFPLEHGLRSTLVAMRLAERLGVDAETSFQTYYGCLLHYVGCTADAELAADLFQDGGLLTHFTPVMFGAPRETIVGIAKALANPSSPPPVRFLQGVGRLPRAVIGYRGHRAAICEVSQMLCHRLGMPPSVGELFLDLTERWDGKGGPAHRRGTEIPLALRIAHVAQDATFHELLGGADHAVQVIGSRAGGAFDPEVVACLEGSAAEVLASDDGPTWEAVLAAEPAPHLLQRGDEIDRALAAMGDFADLISPFLTGHSAAVSGLVGAAATEMGLPEGDVVGLSRAASVHDVGRVAVPAGIWQKAGRLTSDEWERVRLHAYHTGRVLTRSSSLAPLAAVATSHHERLDGSGYHRGASAPDLPTTARLLAAADSYHTKVEPRPHRPAMTPSAAAQALGREVDAGRLDATCVAAVLEAAGQQVPRMTRPAGLTERETEVISMLAQGMATKQIARALGISPKTADRHVQNAYGKIGVSTRAAAAVFAMQHGLIAWGELPMAGPRVRS